MNQLKIYDDVVIDSNIILYYCFNTNETCIVEFTNKTHRLIDFLTRNHINIITPKFIINEIRRMNLSKKIEEMISNNELTSMPKDTGYFIKMKIELKVKHKINQLQQEMVQCCGLCSFK